jgi:hypothetical protein
LSGVEKPKNQRRDVVPVGALAIAAVLAAATKAAFPAATAATAAAA